MQKSMVGISTHPRGIGDKTEGGGERDWEGQVVQGRRSW